MKWFCHIFGLYLLALSCLPCSDGEHVHTQNLSNNPIQVNYTTDEHGCPQHRHCNDLCSPLCGCQCCSSIFFFQKTVVFASEKSQLFPEKQIFAETNFSVKDMAFAIDHPPQLS